MTTVNTMLEPQDFPFTIEVRRSDTNKIVWAVTLLQPRNDPIALPVPPLFKLENTPVMVHTYSGTGIRTITGPYGKEWDGDDED